MSAATIYSLHCPSHCELRPWLLAHGEPGAYGQVLVRLGQRREAIHLAELGDVSDLSERSFEKRIDGADVPYDGWDVPSARFRKSNEPPCRTRYRTRPSAGRSCQACGFRERCWAEAEKRDDVALVYGVDQGLVHALRREGVATPEHLLDRFDETTLAAFTRPWGNRNQRVGRKAGRILEQARATASDSMTVLFPPALPVADHYVMFDLEGVPPQLDELDRVYLWGTQVFGADPGDYQAALAGFGPDGDRRVWEDFLAQSSTIFDAYGDIPFIHWHHYETTKIRAYMDRHGDDSGLARRVLRNCVDLLPITRDAVVLPDPSYSLKVVERRAGYRRTLDEYGGDWSIARYIEAVETDDESAREAIMQEILDYNREDLEPTWAVMVSFRSLA